MVVKIDEEKCVGCELCCDTCPEIFRMGDNVAEVIISDVPEEQEDCVREAAESCPSEAIIVEE
jgi:ferredoxin